MKILVQYHLINRNNISKTLEKIFVSCYDLVNKKNKILEKKGVHMQSYLKTFTEAVGSLHTEQPQEAFDKSQAVSWDNLLVPQGR